MNELTGAEILVSLVAGAVLANGAADNYALTPIRLGRIQPPFGRSAARV